MNKTHTFLKGAAILTAAGLASKLLGAVYRIPLFRVVGSEGMGLYQMAYPLYTMLLALSSAGIPVAISKLVAENLARRDAVGVSLVFRTGMVLIAIVSGVLSLLLFQSAYFLADRMLHDIRAAYSIMAIAPAVFFVGLMSVFRGYFQGFQEMVPTACSQVLEQLVRVVTVLAGAYFFLNRGVEFAAAGATFGAVTGAVAGFGLLAGFYVLRPYYSATPFSPSGLRQAGYAGVFRIMRRIITLALPISLGGLVLPVMQTLDAITVPGRLQLAGYSLTGAVQLYGQLTGAAVTLINLPTAITVSLAASLVPAISRLVERNNYYEVKRQIETATGITILVCLPAAVGLAVLAVPISDLLFNCPEAGRPLVFLAPAAVLLGLHQTTSGILQGMGKTFLPVINLVIGATAKFIVNYTFTAVPQIGITGAAAGTVAGFLLSSYMNFLFIRNLTGWQPRMRIMLLKPGLAATIMAVGVYFTYRQSTIIMSSSLATIVSILAGALLYLTVLLILGTIRDLGIAGKR